MTEDKAKAWLQKHKPMTKTQLKEVVAQYAAQFPGWYLAHDGTAFVRQAGPIQQMIWFQALRTGAYRPTNVIKTTALPMPRMLTQMLDVKNREAKLSQHAVRMPTILAAMEHEFRPDISKPLDVADVLSLCEAEAAAMPDTTNNMTMLSILHAWLGHSSEALGYCERTQHCPLPTLAPMPEWEETMRSFGRDLASAVRAGNGRQFLEMVIEKQQAAG